MEYNSAFWEALYCWWPTLVVSLMFITSSVKSDNKCPQSVIIAQENCATPCRSIELLIDTVRVRDAPIHIFSFLI